MNRLAGTIIDIETSDALSLVKMAVGEYIVSSIVIDTPETLDFLKIGNAVLIFFKETEVIIATADKEDISVQNKIPCEVISLKEGKLLSEISLTFGGHTIKSIITTNAT